MKKLVMLLLFISNSVLAAETCSSLVATAENLSDQGNWGKATEVAKKAVKACAVEKQKTARPHMVLATAANAVEDYEQTIFWSQEALKQEADLPLAYMNMCAGYMGLKKYDDAVNACKGGLKKQNPWSAKINFNAGLALFKKYVELNKFEKTAEAEPFFKASEKIDPKIPDNYYYVGLINQTNGKSKEALDQFAKGCELGHEGCCTSKEELLATTAQPAVKKATAQEAHAVAATPEGEAKLWQKIKEGYIKKGVPAESVAKMINTMKTSYSSLTPEQRISALKNMVDSM